MQYDEIKIEKQIVRGFFYACDSQQLVLLFHGFTGNKFDHHGMLRKYAEVIHALGYNVYRFDFLGSGDSDGTFKEDMRIEKEIQTAKRIISHFEKKGYQVHLFGFSLGGVIASQVLTPDIQSCFLLSPAGNFDDIIDLMIDEHLECNGFVVDQEFVNEAKQFAYYDLPKYENPITLVIGTKDQYVTLQSAKCYQDHFSQLHIHLIYGSDHCFSTQAYTDQVIEQIQTFYGEQVCD